jgi:dienelactone hydrolase
VSGDYVGVDSMGLITSMRLVSGKLKAAMENISADNSLFIDIAAESGNECSKVRIERLFMSSDIRVERISKPFVGAFYYSDNPNNRTVLLLSGSSGKLGNGLPMASLLASHGFNVLAVAYFSEPGLPKELMDIPLEYFENVFDWLADNPITKGKDLYLHCISKGAEVGLILASQHPFIKKIAAIAPHAYCFQGASFTRHASSWTHHNKELPYIRLQFRTLYANLLGCFIRNEPFGYTHTHAAGLRRAHNKEEARIKIENAKADLLLFAGEQDNIWNTYDGCVDIMNTLDKAEYQYKYELIAYENAGHPFYAPYIIPNSIYEPMKIAPRLSTFTGGTLMGNNEAVVDSWERMLAFFTDAS